MRFFQAAFPSEAVSQGRRPAFSGLKQMLFSSSVPFLLIPLEAPEHIWLSGAALQQSSLETKHVRLGEPRGAFISGSGPPLADNVVHLFLLAHFWETLAGLCAQGRALRSKLALQGLTWP